MRFTDYLKRRVVIVGGDMKAPGGFDGAVGLITGYFDNGCCAVCADTFGVNGLYYGAAETGKLISSALGRVAAARERSRAGGEKYIALGIGPTGQRLSPYKDFDFDHAVEAFSQTVKAGVKYGADLIILDAFDDGYECKAALLAVKENSDLPVLVCCKYGDNGRLATGADTGCLIPMLEGMGADAIGVSCTPDGAAEEAVTGYLGLSSVPVIYGAYLGQDPGSFQRTASGLIKRGVRVICAYRGVTPEHIKPLSAEGYAPVPVTDKKLTVISSGARFVRFGEKTVIIGERINPTGKIKLKEAIKNGDPAPLLSEALAQEKAGADALDVNVGVSDGEAEKLCGAVSLLQRTTDLPLALDTASPYAMERALRIYNGCPLVNSVNGRRESMEKIFPLIKKYGGAVVALLFDGDGIPGDPDRRLAVARNIIACADGFGIPKNRILFDALALSAASDPGAASVTLETLGRLKRELGCLTVLGVSNVSFGLPDRQALNSAFLICAMREGLDAAIADPCSDQIMRSYTAYNALSGADEGFARYIAYARKRKE